MPNELIEFVWRLNWCDFLTIDRLLSADLVDGGISNGIGPPVAVLIGRL